MKTNNVVHVTYYFILALTAVSLISCGGGGKSSSGNLTGTNNGDTNNGGVVPTPITTPTATLEPTLTPTLTPTPEVTAEPTATPTPTSTPTPIQSVPATGFAITSPALKNTGSAVPILPLSYTCEGVNGGQSPWLTWSGVPSATQSLVITMHTVSGDDSQAQFTLFNISPNVSEVLPGDFSNGTAAEGDMPVGYSAAADGQAYNPPCATGAGVERDYIITLYALSEELSLTANASQQSVLTALQNITLASTELNVTRTFWSADAIAADLHVPKSVRSTCEEKTADFMQYSRVHKSIECDEANNQMNIISYIGDGLKTALNDQQIQVGITRWIGRLSFPSESGTEIRIRPSYLDGVHNNLSCDGTGKLGVTVDGQIILPYYKQTNDAGGNTCGPTDGVNYANRDTVVLGEVDQCYGHSPNGEGYHLHGAPICLMDVHDPSKPLAYMADGIPLYFGEAGGTIENTANAQSAATVTDTNFGAGLYDHLNFLPSDVKDGTNPLNECNAYDLNGDGATSGYVYYTTKDAPYAIGCFMGELLDAPKPVQVTRTNFDGERQGWLGQTVGEGIDVTIVNNHIGEFENKLYNITELLVTQSTSYLNKGDIAQVLWRALEPGEPGYSQASTCFEHRYRANKNNPENDEVEIRCTRNQVPTETLNFSPFQNNENTANLKSANVEIPTVQEFKLEAWADNWFAAYLADDLIVEDSVPITTEKSFNSETATFSGSYPLQLNFIIKDFIENNTGLEYIGEAKQQVGDGGFIAQVTNVTTGKLVTVSSSNWRCTVLQNAPLNEACAAESVPIAGTAPCEYELYDEPLNWKNIGFDDSGWASATEYTAAQVSPKEGYDDISWSDQAALIWGPDLKTNNTLLCRVTVEAPE